MPPRLTTALKINRNSKLNQPVILPLASLHAVKGRQEAGGEAVGHIRIVGEGGEEGKVRHVAVVEGGG